MKKIFYLFIFNFIFSSISLADELIIEPDAGRAPLLSAMQNAASIDLVMYGLTDSKMIHALSTENHLRILLEPHPYKSETENLRAAEELQAAKVNLRWADPAKLTHQKTFIFDNKSALVMTFNLTHSTFTKERNFALVITDPAMVQEIERVFNADYMHQPISVNNPNLFWSPDNSREKMLSLINQAKSEIDIYAQDVSDYQMIGALAKAARRGVKVTILTSDRGRKSAGKMAYLTRSGVVIKQSNHYIIHAKVLIVDRQSAVLGSINFTAASLDKNRELSVLTHDATVIKALLNTFNQDAFVTAHNVRQHKGRFYFQSPFGLLHLAR